jgi:DNA-binding transcriptional LysR family regulator
LIAAPSHPIASLAKVTLRDVAATPFIVPEGGSRTRLLVERRFREAGVPLRIAMQLPGTEGVKRAVEAGLGVGMVSGYAIEAECATGVLRRVPIDGWAVVRTMNLVYRSQKYFSPVGERFREFARTFGAEHLLPLPAPRPEGEGGRRATTPGARRGAPRERRAD